MMTLSWYGAVELLCSSKLKNAEHDIHDKHWHTEQADESWSSPLSTWICIMGRSRVKLHGTHSRLEMACRLPFIFRENLSPSFLTRWIPNLMGSSSINSSQQKPLTKVPRWTCVVYSFRSVFCAYRLLGFTIQQRNGRWRNHNWPRLVFTGNQVKDMSTLLSFWFIRQNIFQ